MCESSITLETSGELTDPYEEAEWLVSRPGRP